MTDVPALLDEVERLREKLAYAMTVIESYQLDLRNSQEVLTPNILTALANGASLADIGFCQGSIYAEALARLNR